MFPGTPQTQTQNAPLPNGATLLLEIVGAERVSTFFATARGEYPAGSITDVAQSLQGAQDQAIANVNGHADRQPGHHAAGSAGAAVLRFSHPAAARRAR